jgi:hypothetical protein
MDGWMDRWMDGGKSYFKVLSCAFQKQAQLCSNVDIFIYHTISSKNIENYHLKTLN